MAHLVQLPVDLDVVVLVILTQLVHHGTVSEGNQLCIDFIHPCSDEGKALDLETTVCRRNVGEVRKSLTSIFCSVLVDSAQGGLQVNSLLASAGSFG